MNDWKLEAMGAKVEVRRVVVVVTMSQTALSILLAAGFSVTWAWLDAALELVHGGLDGWVHLDMV